MNRRQFVQQSAMGLGAMALGLHCSKSNALPNFVIIYADDMGYGDTSSNGHPYINTPNIDQMADEGVSMTQFYSASAVCSPSRAALLTGRLPIRTGVVRVFFPNSKRGLPTSEVLLPELLKTKGYVTGCIGKWHLGHLPQYLPTRRGFDSYIGVPYSNDMDWKKRKDPPIPLMKDEEIIEQPADQHHLTQRYTEEAIHFIKKNKDKPFFLYIPHTMPHVPIHASDQFAGQSKAGLYGDVIQELDWSVGKILKMLDDEGLSQNTLVVFTSDNGAAPTKTMYRKQKLSYLDKYNETVHTPWEKGSAMGGSNGLFRGHKASTWEGGMREPMIVRFPKMLPAGKRCSELGMMPDLFTTILGLAGVEIPDDRPIDGKNLLPVLQGKARSPHEFFPYYWEDELAAFRVGPYKLHFKIKDEKKKWIRLESPMLFNVEEDPSERLDLAKELPDIVSLIEKKAKAFDAGIRSLGENQDLIAHLLPKKYRK